MQQTTLRTQTPDGVTISVRCLAAGRDRVVIVCPGFLQHKDAPRFIEMAELLSRQFDVLTMDFRGHGDSGGRFTFGAHEPEDLHAVLMIAQQRWPRIGVMGFSLGASTAIIELARHHEAHSLIAVAAPTAFEAIENRWWMPSSLVTAWHNSGQWWRFRPGSLWLPKASSQEAIGHLAPTPTLFLHGTDDCIVHPRHSERLFAEARDPKRLEWFEGGAHAEDLFRQFPDRFTALMMHWFDETLSNPGRDIAGEAQAP